MSPYYLSFTQILGFMSKMQYLVFIHTKISAHLMHQAMNRETREYVWSPYHLINCINFNRVKTTDTFAEPTFTQLSELTTCIHTGSTEHQLSHHESEFMHKILIFCAPGQVVPCSLVHSNKNPTHVCQNITLRVKLATETH